MDVSKLVKFCVVLKGFFYVRIGTATNEQFIQSRKQWVVICKHKKHHLVLLSSKLGVVAPYHHKFLRKPTNPTERLSINLDATSLTVRIAIGLSVNSISILPVTDRALPHSQANNENSNWHWSLPRFMWYYIATWLVLQAVLQVAIFPHGQLPLS